MRDFGHLNAVRGLGWKLRGLMSQDEQRLDG